MARNITLNVIQGLGDIFWVYQKFAPYFERINLNVYIVHHGIIQTRSREWLKKLPQVGQVEFKTVSPAQYENLYATKLTLPQVFSQWQENKPVPYCCNRWLEEGMRLEAIDPNYPVEWNVPYPVEPISLPFKDYYVFYVSAAAKDKESIEKGFWQLPQWFELFELFLDKYGVLPVFVIGALFDVDVVREIGSWLKSKNIPVQQILQAAPSRVMHYLKQSRFFIGSQSGLNILADNFNVKQLMMYYPYLEKMTGTWCKQGNLGIRYFSALFSQTPDEILKGLPKEI